MLKHALITPPVRVLLLAGEQVRSRRRSRAGSAPVTRITDRRQDHVPLAADLFIGLVFSGWLAAFVLSLRHLSPHDAWVLLPVIVVTAIARRFNLGIYASDTYMSVTMIGNLAAGILYGVPGAVLCSTVAMLCGWTGRAKLRQTLFNVSEASLSNGVAATLFLFANYLAPMSGPVVQAPAALLAGLVTALCESALVSVIVALTQGRPPWRVWQENFRWSLPYWMGMGVVALGLALTYRGAGLVGLLAFTGPVLLMRYVTKQYLDHTTRSVKELSARNSELEEANHEIRAMAGRLEETYTGTLEALVAALDARDRETRGHSVRVSQLTMLLAREMGIAEGTQQWTDIERGALLHDIGKIGVADAILRKPGVLAEDEWAEMRRHTRVGFDMLKDIPFLAGAAEMVAAHHEHWDGRGYPRGLAGGQIPFGARIFALADTFDAMATDRPYRRARSYEACLAELERCAGSQFDPAAVAALRAVYPQWVELHRESLARVGVGRLSAVA